MVLAELPGIGSSLADAIVNYREIHGDFSAISDIILVDGIGAVGFIVVASSKQDCDGECCDYFQKFHSSFQYV